MMAERAHILLVEDDPSMGFLLEEFLLMAGYDVTLCKDGQEGLRAFRAGKFDLCLLDVMLPMIDGFCLGEQIRKYRKDLPIIFLTARTRKEDKLRGFRLGADDYIVKPFDEDVLLCRIQAILRRVSDAEPEPVDIEIFTIGDAQFNYATQSLQVKGKSRRITERESEVLRLLCLNKNNILRRQDALERIWGTDDYFLGRSFDVFIAKLRKYLKDEPNVRIENVFGVGFMLVEEEG